MGALKSPFSFDEDGYKTRVVPVPPRITFSFPLLRETNLKVREPLPETAALGEDVTKLSEFDGEGIHSLGHTHTHTNISLYKK